jgi:hypothetical protein
MKKLIAIAFLLNGFLLFSQEKIEVNALLYNGKRIIGASNLKEINVRTNYGNFNIPIKKAKQIYFGLKADPNIQTKINAYLADLQSNSELVQKNAYTKILEIGIKSIPIISKYIDANDEMIAPNGYSPTKVYNDLLESTNAVENLSEMDILEFDADYRIQGNVLLQKIEINTEFGLQSIPVSNICTMEISTVESFGGITGYKLMANKQISSEADGWINTGIKLKAGQKLNISANGVIKLASLSNAKYTPDGAIEKIAEVAADPAPMTIEDSSVSIASMDETVRFMPPVVTEEPYYAYPEYGQLVYKIGETGETLKAGSKFTGKIEKTGTLYLSIYETSIDKKNSGFFTAKVKVFK